ncbi:MAG: Major Facilitator Superfamily protein [Firmicutes bacterium ADurb.Bin262]|nr:MAG: Major Facilitator Superfamily protein [Firmicutes bacterium ADurb.Bin262]
MSDGNITLVYSMAMIVDAVAAVLVGKAYDRLKKKSGSKTGGLAVLMAIPLASLPLPFLTLSDSAVMPVIGMVIFGIVMGTHETVMRSAIADITPFSKRGTGYGVFNTAYGLALLGGASLMGWLYDLKQTNVIMLFACCAQAAAFIMFIKIRRMAKADNG